MNDEDRKLLTEWLGGECFHVTPIYHDWYKERGGEQRVGWICPKCDNAWTEPRTFTSPADFFAVRDRLVEKDEWDEFKTFSWHLYADDLDVDDFILWLTSKTDDGTYRLCELVAEWLMEKNYESK